MNAQIYRMAIVHHEVYILFLMIAILIILNIRQIKTEFSNVKRKTWIMLALIFMIALGVRMNVLHIHLIYQDEPYYGTVAKSMVLYNNAAITYYDDFNQLDFLELTKNYMGWSFILSIGYFLFGVKDLVAVYFTSFIGAITIPLIFIFSYLLFRKERVSLLAAFFFSILPLHVFWSSTSVANISSLFFVILALIAFILYSRTLDNKLNLLGVLLLMFTIQIRPENILLIPTVWILYFIFIRKFRQKINIGFWIPWFIFIILFMIYIPQLNQMFGYIGSFYSSSIENINIKIDLMTLFVKYNLNQPLYMVIFLLIGLRQAFRNYKKETLFLGILYLATPVFFILWQGWDTYRYFFINYFCILSLQSMGVLFVYNKLRRKKKIIALVFALIVLVSMIAYAYSDINNYYLQKGVNKYILSTRVPAMIEADIDDNCYVITNDEDSVTLTSGSLLKVMVLKDIRISIKKRIKDIDCLMYFEGIICTRPSVKQEEAKKCTEIHNYFNLEYYKEYNSPEANYKLYKLELKNQDD